MLPVTVIVPLSDPTRVGVKLTLTVQEEATASLLGAMGQLLDSTKSVGPLYAMELISKGIRPPLVSVPVSVAVAPMT